MYILVKSCVAEHFFLDVSKRNEMSFRTFSHLQEKIFTHLLLLFIYFFKLKTSPLDQWGLVPLVGNFSVSKNILYMADFTTIKFVGSWLLWIYNKKGERGNCKIFAWIYSLGHNFSCHCLLLHTRIFINYTFINKYINPSIIYVRIDILTINIFTINYLQ